MLWTATDHEASYSSPVSATFDGRTTRAVLHAERPRRPRPGDRADPFQRPWRSRSQSSVNAATPLVIGDLIFVSATYETGATVMRVSGNKLTELWASDDALSNHYATSVYHDGYLYGFHGRQEFDPSFRAVDVKTGAVKWSVRSLSRRIGDARRRPAADRKGDGRARPRAGITRGVQAARGSACAARNGSRPPGHLGGVRLPSQREHARLPGSSQAAVTHVASGFSRAGTPQSDA